MGQLVGDSQTAVELSIHSQRSQAGQISLAKSEKRSASRDVTTTLNKSSSCSRRRQECNRTRLPHPPTNTPLLGYWQVVMTTGMKSPDEVSLSAVQSDRGATTAAWTGEDAPFPFAQCWERTGETLDHQREIGNPGEAVNGLPWFDNTQTAGVVDAGRGSPSCLTLLEPQILCRYQ